VSPVATQVVRANGEGGFGQRWLSSSEGQSTERALEAAAKRGTLSFLTENDSNGSKFSKSLRNDSQ
jgi:hypothetical protein